MAGSFDISAGVMTITKDGRVVFDTSRPLMNLVPSAAIELDAFEVSFPDLWHGTVYHQLRQSSGPPFDIDSFGCATFTGFVEQEWGPAAASPNTLADEVLGTVPEGTDYLDVMINITNTLAPPGWLDLAMRTNFPSGEWVKLEGGSCLIEFFPGMRRQFDIVLDGTDVVLRRYQSITANGDVLRRYNQTSANSTSHYIGFVAGTNAPVDNTFVKRAIRGAPIQYRGLAGSPDPVSSWGPGGSNGCALASSSYATTWSGDVIITPGRISA